MTVYGSSYLRRPWRIADKKTGPINRRLIAVWEDEMKGEPKLTREERNLWHNPVCSNCGHFTSWYSDNYTNYGGPCDTDPPDPEYLCDRCVAVEIAEAMIHGLRWAHWIPARYEYDVARLLSLVRISGRWS